MFNRIYSLSTPQGHFRQVFQKLEILESEGKGAGFTNEKYAIHVKNVDISCKIT